MQIFDDNKKRVAVITAFSNREIETTLSSGDKILRFEYPANNEKSAFLKEEYYIRTETDEYVIKAIEKGDKYNRYEACLNVEELEGIIFPYGFESRTQTARACLEFAFQGSGWTVGACDLKKKRTINKDEVCTAWDILQDTLKTYMCECTIDSLNKRIDVCEKVGSYKGCYFMEGLNLRKLGLKSDTYDFYTRIYPIGKDGITPELATGKAYIDNNSYSKKIKPFVWKDERYENTAALIEDATAKLESVARPLKAYDVEIVDLAKINSKYKNILDFKIGDTVKIISKKKKIKEIQRIVKLKEYPENPEKNTAEISNVKKTFAEIQEEANEDVRSDAIDQAVNLSKKVIAQGYYTKEEVNLRINSAKEEITMGVSTNYETIQDSDQKHQDALEKAGLAKNDAIAAGQAAADQAEANAKNDTNTKLTKYYTKEQTDSAIKVAKEAITLGVSQTYETIQVSDQKHQEALNAAGQAETNATQAGQAAADQAESNATFAGQSAAAQAAAQAEANAKNDTDTKLQNYPTKTELNAAIKVEADNITQVVSATYETIEEADRKKNDAIAAGQSAADQAESNAESSLSSYKKEIGTYFRHDVKGLELGEVAADTKINITPKAVEFSDGGVVTAFVNNKAFRFTEGVVENRLRIGGYVFKKEPSGEVSLEWEEESETTIEEASVL